MMRSTPRGARGARLTRAALLGAALAGAAPAVAAAQSPDPFAANNAVYPDSTVWKGRPFRLSNYDYPTLPVTPRWLAVRPRGPITRETAPAYVAAVKKFIEKDIAGLVNDPHNWQPTKVGWYDMPWGGQAAPMANGKLNPEDGRDPILGSYTGQLIENISYPPGQQPKPKQFQNHAQVYYNDVAGYQIGAIFRNPYKPDLSKLQFPEGSIVVKVEGVTLAVEDWPSPNGLPPVLQGSTESFIYRPTVADMNSQPDPTKWKPVKTPMRFLQMAVRVKDRVASPKTGWVFMAFYYDSRSTGATVWDRTRPAGAMWGNDPQFAMDADGGKGKLTETWVAPDLAGFVRYGLGWGGRLAGPLDVGLRHDVVTMDGRWYSQGKSFAASSCVSCHGSAQYPFIANLYPSPNKPFPEDGSPFMFFTPGSREWANYFQNRPGSMPMTGRGRSGIVASDYDMMLTFALSAANAGTGAEAFQRPKIRVH